MRKPVVDYRQLRPSNITSPQYRHLLLLLGWVVYFVLYFTTENAREVDHVLNASITGTPFDPGACTRGLYLRGLE